MLPAFQLVAQSVGEASSDATGSQSARDTEDWTGPPIVSDSSYFGNGGRWWGGAGAVLWSVKPASVPTLATTGTNASLGVLGDPGTTTLFGGNLDGQTRVGGQFTAGYWLDPNQTKGIEGSFFFLGNPSDNSHATTSGAAGSSLITRPFINAITGLQDGQLVGFPGVTGGGVDVHSHSQFLGAGVNGIFNLCGSGCCTSCCATDCCQTGYGTGQNSYYNNDGYRVDLLGGFRYLNLNENLTIVEDITVLPTAPLPFVPGSTILVTDSFQTRNNFYGGQIGLRAERRWGGWFGNVANQIAIGSNHQDVFINGNTVFTTPPAAPIQQPGGLLALPTNIGSYSRDRFSVVPQASLNIGRQVTPNLRVYAGYTLMYWTNVLRPGDQIDPVVNPTQLPTAAGPSALVGPARPAFAFNETNIWAQGVNLGVEFRR